MARGLIRAYAWSTDDPARAAVFVKGPHCAAAQHALNVLTDAPEMLRPCEEAGLASVNRSPLAMGLLTGKHADRRPLGAGDIRSRPPAWLRGFGEGAGANRDTYLAANPHLRFYDGRRGYVTVALGREAARADFRTVPYVTRPGAPVTAAASFVTAAGGPGLEPA